jgi:hypothetical protein
MYPAENQRQEITIAKGKVEEMNFSGTFSVSYT